MHVQPQSCSSSNESGALLPWYRFQAAADAAEIDAVIASSPENVTYLSEYWGLSHWARRGTQVYAIAWSGSGRSVDLIAPATLADLVTAEVAEQTRPHAYGRFVLEPADELDPDETRLLALAGSDANPASALEHLVALLGRRLPSGGRIAVEADGMASGVLEALRRACPRIELAPADGLLTTVRAVKSPREIELLRRAAHIAETAVAAAADEVRAGTSEQVIARRFLCALVEADALPETTVLGAGRRSALPNGLPGSSALARGDILRFDVGCRVGHYVSDIARSFAVSRADGQQRAAYAALSAGLEAAAEALRPGTTGGAVFDAAVTAVRANGLPDYERTHCGHGIGIANYDLPRIAPGGDDLIEPGMVICLETPYYRLGAYGLQVEDTFAVTRDGAERFTAAPAELRILGA